MLDTKKSYISYFLSLLNNNNMTSESRIFFLLKTYFLFIYFLKNFIFINRNKISSKNKKNILIHWGNERIDSNHFFSRKPKSSVQLIVLPVKYSDLNIHDSIFNYVNLFTLIKAFIFINIYFIHSLISWKKNLASSYHLFLNIFLNDYLYSLNKEVKIHRIMIWYENHVAENSVYRFSKIENIKSYGYVGYLFLKNYTTPFKSCSKFLYYPTHICCTQGYNKDVINNFKFVNVRSFTNFRKRNLYYKNGNHSYKTKNSCLIILPTNQKEINTLTSPKITQFLESKFDVIQYKQHPSLKNIPLPKCRIYDGSIPIENFTIYISGTSTLGIDLVLSGEKCYFLNVNDIFFEPLNSYLPNFNSNNLLFTDSKKNISLKKLSSYIYDL